MTQINQADFNVFKAKAISRGKLLDKVRNRIVEITDHIQNEGDRAYFGSTNHADELVKLFHELDGLRWGRIIAERPERDPYADCFELRTSIAVKDAEITYLRNALGMIAGPRDCGCSPVCQCDDASALKVEIDYLKDVARSALPRLKENANAL